ncbi:putative Cytochrome P450 [Hibiscus syriacus]|uniref:Cytochrome P450 n=1 Tax=Hibiscus syriacus TaxID=106335 RepID=A0A6A2X8Z9_HIBSY|nr:putative Cytochrome P450 [Hibiscus syriacus]
MAVSPFMIFLLPLPFFLFVLLKRSINNNRNRYLLPPSPPGLPLIGHLHLLMFDDSAPHVFFHKLSQKYGLLVFLRLGFKPTLVISSAKMAEEEMRKICSVHLFSRVQEFCPVREDEVARLIGKICRLSVESNPVNLSEAMACLSSSIICTVGFGKRYDDQGAEIGRFHGLLKESEAMFTSFSFADYFPFIGWIDGFTGFLTPLDKIFKELDTFYQELIDEHLDPNKPKSERDGILDVLLRLWKNRDFSFDFTMDHVKAILMVISSLKTFA